MWFYIGWRRELRGKEATEEEKRGKSCKIQNISVSLPPE
jgi:hypothetical protein